MYVKRKIKRVVCGAISFFMLIGNGISGMTVYAAGEKLPVTLSGLQGINHHQDTDKLENVFINDTPVRLQVSKIKTPVGAHEGIDPKNSGVVREDTITYKISGRVDGSIADIMRNYGDEQVELAYSSSGVYLGYGWMKGTLEYLLNRKSQGLGEEVQILYNEYGVFSGYGTITRKLATEDDTNRYVAGSTMTLYDAVEIFRDLQIEGDGQDYREDDRFLGVKVIRDGGSNNVTSAYVEKGYAGKEAKYVLQKNNETLIEVDANGNVINNNYNYQDEINDTGKGTWIAKTIQRENTPILFYSMDNLQLTTNDRYVNLGSNNEKLVDTVFGAERFEKKDRVYGFDRVRNVIDITQTDETDFSVYAFKEGDSRPTYELTGGDYKEIQYSLPEKRMIVGEGTLVYHLDQDGNRDSLVDPQTGIAYIIEEPVVPPARGKGERLLVWPVNVFKDGSGSGSGNVGGSQTFRKILTTRIATINADTQNEYTTGTFDGKTLTKSMNPVLDLYGHPLYYRRSNEIYIKGQDTYDYDGDEYTGFVYEDSLDAENENAYAVNDHETLYNGDADNPFDQSTHYQYSDKQSVKITVDLNGNYVINGNKSVPIPTRKGYVFAGWLLEPDALTNGGTVNAYWRNSSGSMSEEEKQQWYSDRTATGPTRQLTVTFQANGGEFRMGAGDIHSTDNILYRRLGDAYIIENIWTSGENTPNDPFDTTLVDTVENIAKGNNTVNHSTITGNDVYSSTTAGGHADMLKRVNDGVYIMEESKPAAGYVKALPVGVTVKEHTNVQQVEMADVTVKAEFIKRDAPVKGSYDLYINGELQKDEAGVKKQVKEPKGSFSYAHVNGAVLALKASDNNTKKAFSDWVKVTQNPRITKKTENGFFYFEFSGNEPLYIEGMPTGSYVLSEVITPPGYVTMNPQDIVITPTDGVHVFEMNDDHTKVEIEKYYNDGAGNKNLPNAYRATLSLIDGKGNTVSTWKTDDISDYTGASSNIKNQTFWQKITGVKSAPKSFIEQFNEMIQTGNLDFTEISWSVVREAVKSSASTKESEIWILSDGMRIVCENGAAPDDAPEAFRDAYAKRNQEDNSFSYEETMLAKKDETASKNLANQIWSVSNGTRMHICVYGGNATGTNGRQEYFADFKFNYADNYTGSFENTVSYDTIEGRHRFDYLPQGNYSLKESGTPEGFVTAADQVIIVNDSGELQRFTMENKRRQLVIAKTAFDGKLYYAGVENGVVVKTDDPKQAAVMKGAKLSLYYSKDPIVDFKTAFKAGNVPQGAALADSWVSGGDGKYTESDYKNELIRKDQIGDYKPHRITDISNGWYYLVETETPSYYKTIEVKEIQVTDQSTSDTLTEILAVNEPIPLEVKVYKKNGTGSLLSGAVFEVKNKTLGGITVGTLTTGVDGIGKLIIRDIGRLGEDGVLQPYTFTIQEISAPAGYKLDPTIHEFVASPDYHETVTIMVNPNDASITLGGLFVTDQVSEITISKSDFNTGEAVPGTKLAVYEAEYSDGQWKNTGNQGGSDWTWVIKNNEITHEVTGLAAGNTYVLSELEVPAGYTKADDIYFKVAASGSTIEKIWYDTDENPYISFKADTTGAVERVTFSTRAAVGTYVTLKDLDAGTGPVNYGTLTGGYVDLTSKDVVDDHRYVMEERIRYTDGREDLLGTTTFIAKLHNDCTRIDLNDDFKYLSVEITDEDDKEIVSFIPDKNTGEYTVLNPLASDPDGLTVISHSANQVGENHSAVQAGKNIVYQIHYEGIGKELVVIPAGGLSYLSMGAFTLEADGYYHLVTAEDSGVITFVASVKDSASGYVNQQVSINGKPYTYLNPIAVNKGESGTIFEKSSKLVISSAVAGNHPDNDNAAFTLQVTLTKADGSPLDGGYDFRTRHSSGILDAFGKKTEFELTVSGNDFITISDLPYGVHYQVRQIIPSDYDFTVTNTAPDGVTNNTAVSNVLFTNTRNTSADREIFKKNTGYILSENLNFNKQDPMILTKYGFSFGENCEIKDIGMLNKPTEIWFVKTDWTTGAQVEGAHCVLMDEDGNVIKDALGNEMKWVSGKEPVKFVGVLEAGKTYRYHEELAPDGYSYSVDVIFTVSNDGIINKVIMQDKPTVVYFEKTDFAGIEISGAECELWVEKEDGTKTLVDSWVSGQKGHKIEGKLIPEKTYYFKETTAPNGYAYSEVIAFFLDKDGMVVNAHYVNDDGRTILYDKDGYPTDIIKLEDGTYRYHDREVTIVNGNALDENGTLLAEGVKEEIEVINNVIQMKDAPFNVSFSKTDFSGNEIPGAYCWLDKVNPDGTTIRVDTWKSGDKPHVMDRNLSADATYRYYEELAPEGYGYSEAIEFTIDRDGVVTDAHYINADGKPVLYDKYGYPTGIVKHEDGTFTDGEDVIIIDGFGNAVDEQGNIRAEGIQFDIPVDKNVIQMKDAKTEQRIVKVDEEGAALPGAKFQILDKDEKGVLAVNDTLIPSTEHAGMIKKGEQLIFLSDGTLQGVLITGQLIAGKEYILREITPPGGYIAGSDKVFTIPYLNQKEAIEVIIKNKPTNIFFKKTDFAGKEVPGARCQLERVTSDGSVEPVDRWISGDSAHKMEGILRVNTTYRYHEESAPEGYGYSASIEFTINESGNVINAHYINAKGEPILFDKDGYETGIVKHEDGTYTEGNDKITIDENKNAVDESGNIRGEGVQFDLPVVGNVIQMKDAPSEVLLIKTDLDGNALKGGKFQILTIDETPVYAMKDTQIPSTEHSGNIMAGEALIFSASPEGIQYTGQLKAGEEYILKELEAPVGHYPGEGKVFRVPRLNQKNTLRIVMENKPSQLEFSKTDWTTGKEVPGAYCVLKYENGQVVVDENGERCEWITGEQPKVFKGVLTPGATYYYCEEVAPSGYGYSKEISFTVNMDGSIQKVEMKDKPTEILITKYGLKEGLAPEQAEPVAGAVLQILKEDKTPAIALIDSVPDKNGVKVFKKGSAMIFTSTLEGTNITGQLNADETYFLRELTAPNGYYKTLDVAFTVSHDGSLVRVNMYDEPTMAKLLKVDSEGTPLKGAKLEIRNAKTWDVLDHWITDGNARDITGILSLGTEYVMVEAEAPDGYYKADPVHFYLSKEGITEVKMVDHPIILKLMKVSKETGESLNGGRFTVLRKEDKAVMIPEFELNGEITLTGQLEAGETYLFCEITPPSGYQASGDVEFTIPITKPKEIIKVVMENPKKPGGGDNGGGENTSPSITIKKYDGMTMKALPGAEFTIFDRAGNIYKIVTTDKNGYVTVKFSETGTYTFKETKAPEGYEPNDKIHTFEITSSSNLTESVPNYDTPPNTIISKKDAETGEAIAGVWFEITNESGEVVFTGTTDIYGQITFRPTEYGSYAVRETKVPKGYEKSDGYITFTVTPAGIFGETTFFNNKVDAPPIVPPENPGKKPGTVTASYDNGADGMGSGWFDRDGNWHKFANPLKTGDRFPFMFLGLIAAAGCTGFIIIKKKEKRK